MRILSGCLLALLFTQSCHINSKKVKRSNPFLKCDELNIVYYSKDTFVFKTTATSTIDNFTELINGNEKGNLPFSDQIPTEQLIYKRKGEIFFTAYVFNHDDKNGIRIQYVSYTLQNKSINIY